ncbi:hypothetical protein [Lysobacter sp. D1-1-M9]|uniref:hypothetical protein n=1 Tax=Novilysobacter longmucuonensis TaxID=3098603 RepID=UPI002FC93015
MEIDFSIGSMPAKLRRGWLLGGMKLVTPGESVWLQHPLQLSTHFSSHLDRSWQHTVAGHEVFVKNSRPLLVAGIRPHNYQVFVDGELVAGARGV